eukprot:767645-Hanusia_phi.AAC.3
MVRRYLSSSRRLARRSRRLLVASSLKGTRTKCWQQRQRRRQRGGGNFNPEGRALARVEARDLLREIPDVR